MSKRKKKKKKIQKPPIETQAEDLDSQTEILPNCRENPSFFERFFGKLKSFFGWS